MESTEIDAPKERTNTDNSNAPNATETPSSTNTHVDQNCSLASKQLAEGFLEIFEPPLVKARDHLKELIGKQNKIYVELAAEKFKLDSAELAKLNSIMNNVKVYRDKLMKIKKQMHSIYHRTQTLKKRSLHIEACKQKQLQRKLQKQQQEEALINK